MPGLRPVGWQEWTLVDAQYLLLDPRPTPVHLLLCPSMIAPGAQGEPA